MESPFVEKIKHMISSRYGKTFKLRQLLDANQEALIASPSMLGSDFHIPIAMNGVWLGSGIIPGAEDMNEDSKKSASELVKMILEPSLYNWYLEQKESNLMSQTDETYTMDNLEFLDETSPTTNPQLTTDIETAETEAASETSLLSEKLMTHFIHLEGSDENQIKKVALNINEMTSRWAFVPFCDIKNQLHSAKDISKMGAMSIFIPQIEMLNSFEQEILIDYLTIERAFEEPIIISSSKETVQNLVEKEMIHSDILDEVVINSIDIQRIPKTPHGLQEMLELMLIKSDDLIS